MQIKVNFVITLAFSVFITGVIWRSTPRNTGVQISGSTLTGASLRPIYRLPEMAQWQFYFRWICSCYTGPHLLKKIYFGKKKKQTWIKNLPFYATILHFHIFTWNLLCAVTSLDDHLPTGAAQRRSYCTILTWPNALTPLSVLPQRW